jgi:hypothetical protein
LTGYIFSHRLNMRLKLFRQFSLCAELVAKSCLKKGRRTGFNEAIVEEKAFQLVGLLGLAPKALCLCATSVGQFHRYIGEGRGLSRC